METLVNKRNKIKTNGYLITYEFQLNLGGAQVFLLIPRPRRGEGLGEGGVS